MGVNRDGSLYGNQRRPEIGRSCTACAGWLTRPASALIRDGRDPAPEAADERPHQSQFRGRGGNLERRTSLRRDEGHAARERRIQVPLQRRGNEVRGIRVIERDLRFAIQGCRRLGAGGAVPSVGGCRLHRLYHLPDIEADHGSSAIDSARAIANRWYSAASQSASSSATRCSIVPGAVHDSASSWRRQASRVSRGPSVPRVAEVNGSKRVTSSPLFRRTASSRSRRPAYSFGPAPARTSTTAPTSGSRSRRTARP